MTQPTMRLDGPPRKPVKRRDGLIPSLDKRGSRPRHGWLFMFAVSWIFLPSTYSHTPPVKPYVEGLPDPRETVEVWSWQHTRIYGRNGGWNRYERTYYNGHKQNTSRRGR